MGIKKSKCSKKESKKIVGTADDQCEYIVHCSDHCTKSNLLLNQQQWVITGSDFSKQDGPGCVHVCRGILLATATTYVFFPAIRVISRQHCWLADGKEGNEMVTQSFTFSSSCCCFLKEQGRTRFPFCTSVFLSRQHLALQQSRILNQHVLY